MSGLSTKSYNNIQITPPTVSETAEVLLCRCISSCFFEERVFADSLGSGEHWKSDFSSFLTRKVLAGDTVTFEIYKNGSLVATVVDSTFGTYYSTFTAQPLYVGFIADWTAIFNAFSGGKYNIKIQSTILGVSSTLTSRDFRLNAYNAELAHRTAKLETYQDGNILGSDFDFTDLVEGGWYDSIRLPATFGQKTPVLITDNYFDSNYKLTQNRPSVEYEYILQADLIPETLASAISSNNILANSILLTSDNQNNNEQLRRVPVSAESFDEVAHYQNGKVSYTIKFKDRVQNIIKRNF